MIHHHSTCRCNKTGAVVRDKKDGSPGTSFTLLMTVVYLMTVKHIIKQAGFIFSAVHIGIYKCTVLSIFI